MMSHAPPTQLGIRNMKFIESIHDNLAAVDAGVGGLVT
jgi:hypothetical protein